jgi:hypothetical protein
LLRPLNSTLSKAYLEAENDAEEKAHAKRLDQVHKRWIRLVQGLRIRDRLRKQYASNMDDATQQHWLDTQNAEAHQGEQVCFISIRTCDLDVNLISPPATRRVPHHRGRRGEAVSSPQRSAHRFAFVFTFFDHR